MNILFVGQSDNTNGGAASILKQVAEYHLKNGADVYMLFLKRKKYGHWENTGYSNLHLYYGGGLYKFVSNLRKISAVKYDYSYNSVVKFTGFVGLLKRLKIFQIKTMVGRESTSIFLRFKGLRLLYYRMWYMVGYKAVNVLICQSELMKKQLLDHVPWLANSARVIVNPNPVNVAQMNIKANEKIEGLPTCPFVVTAGRFIPEKAYDVLLNSFNEFSMKHLNWKLVILGDGALRYDIEEQINSLHLEDRVILEGQVDNVFPWFKKASLCVISSRMEGFPNVLLQMMSQNIKVVSTLCAGGIEDIQGLVTCPINDPVALCNAMNKCIDCDSANNREMFDRELENRSIDNFMNRIEQNNY